MLYYTITNRTNGAIGIANRQISPGKSITVAASLFDHQPYRNGLNILLRNELITCTEEEVGERMPGSETPIEIIESLSPSDPTEKAPVEEVETAEETVVVPDEVEMEEEGDSAPEVKAVTEEDSTPTSDELSAVQDLLVATEDDSAGSMVAIGENEVVEGGDDPWPKPDSPAYSEEESLDDYEEEDGDEYDYDDENREEDTEAD